MSVFLGIDTSNYTTSVAAFDSETGSMVSEKLLLQVSENSRGLRQSDAVFLHVKQLGEVASRVLSKINGTPTAIGFSAFPCDNIGSYMPCFLVGKMVAQCLAAAYKIPAFEFSHQRGHIAAALYSVDRLDMLDSEFLALHVSGGTTDLIKVTPDKDKIVLPQCVGKSLDLKAGQAVDRVGVMLSLNFPCGPELEKLASNSNKTFKIKPCVKGLDCSLSGIENKCQKMLENGELSCDIAKFCIDYILKTLSAVCQNAREIYPKLPFVFAGGVMSNKYLKEYLQKEFGGYFAEPRFSSDNAAGIAVLAQKAYSQGISEFDFSK